MRLQHGMAGALLRLLPGPAQVGGIEGFAYLLAAMTIDHADARRTKLARGIDDVGQQGLPRQRMQYLGQGGMHPLALAPRQG
jgi:hypothetical protein